ncbi:MAG: hypothetical protein QN229_02795 [Desulfurococcaceae archaeon TW002]
MVGSRVPEVLLGIVFLLSLITSLYLRNYLLVLVTGLITYTYMVLAGHAVSALVIMLTSLPFQFLVAGPHAVHLIAYFSLVLVMKSLIHLRKSYFIFIPTLVPVLAYLILFHPVIEVPPLHYLLVCCVALLIGYFLRVVEELISFGITYLEVPELDLSRLLNTRIILNIVVLACVVPAFSTTLLFVLLSYGLIFTQSLFASVVIGFVTTIAWFLFRGLILRIALLIGLIVFVAVFGGSWLLSIFDESLRMFEEVLRYFG